MSRQVRASGVTGQYEPIQIVNEATTSTPSEMTMAEAQNQSSQIEFGAIEANNVSIYDDEARLH